MGVRTAVEIGPKTVLKNLSNKNVKYINSFSYDKEDDIKEFFRLTNTKDKINAHSLIDRCIAEAVCTKNYNYNEEEYQRGVIDNYRILQNMQSQLNNQGSEATKDQMLDAVKILKEILMSKLLPESQQLESLKRILEESSMSSLLSHIS
jgi:[acyl-carrier-protein] S-malonyltransferase